MVWVYVVSYIQTENKWDRQWVDFFDDLYEAVKETNTKQHEIEKTLYRIPLSILLRALAKYSPAVAREFEIRHIFATTAEAQPYLVDMGKFSGC